MNLLKQVILNKIEKYKHLPYGTVIIHAKHKKTKYQLFLLTDESVKNKTIINLLAKWRNHHQKWFPSQFKVTKEGTKKWLKEKVIEVPDRLLFMIRVNNKYLGHVGLFRFDFDNVMCELDNIVRGESTIPGIMTSACLEIMNWGKQKLGIKWYQLTTSSDNIKAVQLYQRLGFREVKRVLMVQVKKNGGTEWVEAKKNHSEKMTRYHLVMINKKIAFAGPSITEKEVEYAVEGVISGFYETYDQHAKKLEKAIADFLGVKYTIATHCCTLALHLACAAIGLKPGDEVICTDFSWIATAYSIVYTGATPVFVDIDPDTWCIDPKAIEKAVTKKTKAIMLVHTFGYPADMDEIMRIARKNNLKVIEDAAPALGAEYKGKKVGTIGDIGCFSFQGAKVTVTGEGGIFVTNDKKIYEKALMLATMGRTDSQAVFWSDSVGYQYTISNLSAALALAQVERIDELVAKKRQIFDWYYKRLKDFDRIKLIKEKKGYKSNYCYPSMLLNDDVLISREELLKKLRGLNIHARPAFPNMGQFPPFKNEFKSKLKFENPVATKVAKRGICLPAAANLTEDDVLFVCNSLKKIVS